VKNRLNIIGHLDNWKEFGNTDSNKKLKYEMYSSF